MTATRGSSAAAAGAGAAPAAEPPQAPAAPVAAAPVEASAPKEPEGNPPQAVSTNGTPPAPAAQPSDSQAAPQETSSKPEVPAPQPPSGGAAPVAGRTDVKGQTEAAAKRNTKKRKAEASTPVQPSGPVTKRSRLVSFEELDYATRIGTRVLEAMLLLVPLAAGPAQPSAAAKPAPAPTVPAGSYPVGPKVGATPSAPTPAATVKGTPETAGAIIVSPVAQASPWSISPVYPSPSTDLAALHANPPPVQNYSPLHHTGPKGFSYPKEPIRAHGEQVRVNPCTTDRTFLGVWDRKDRQVVVARYDKRGEERGKKVYIGTWSPAECSKLYGISLELASEICQTAAAECMEGYMYAREIAYAGEESESVGSRLHSLAFLTAKQKARIEEEKARFTRAAWVDFIERAMQKGFRNWFVNNVSASKHPELGTPV